MSSPRKKRRCDKKDFFITSSMCMGSVLKPNLPYEDVIDLMINFLKSAVREKNADNVAVAFRMLMLITNSFPADPEFTLPLLVEQCDDYYKKFETFFTKHDYEGIKAEVMKNCRLTTEHAIRMNRD